MNILIVEDELPARDLLKAGLAEVWPQARLVGECASIAETLAFFQSQTPVDLAFFDIRLSDGLSFEIFRQFPVQVPVIFLSAYDQYLLEAFHTNSIDYLLKPLKTEQLRTALGKYEQLKSHFLLQLPQLLQHLQSPQTYKTRFLAEKGGDYFPIDIADIAYFFSEYKLSFIMTFSGTRYLVEKSLAALEAELDPAVFRRANRQVIVSNRAVKRISSVSKSKLLLELQPSPPFEVLVSQEGAAGFKVWVGG